MAASVGLSSSYTAEVREKLSLWDVKDSPLAPLTDKQRNSVLELTTVAGDRPLLDEVNLQTKHVTTAVVEIQDKSSTSDMMSLIVCSYLMMTALICLQRGS